MPGFLRRFSYYPTPEVITQIEGLTIVDLPPPQQATGVGTGCVACVGEFSDMSAAVTVSSAGVVSTKCVPVEIFSSRDMIDKVGGWDETIGDFGTSGGNGFADIRGKSFSRLVVAPVNLCSAQGARFFRELPLNYSATNSLPVVPFMGASIAAGREFRNGSGRMRIGRRVDFTALPPITTGVGGASIAGASAATQVFNATGGFDWTLIARPDGSLGARKGDILVIGYNAAGAKSVDAGTYRVQADPSSGIAVTVESLSGANFAFTGAATVSWRLHVGSDADSAPVVVTGSTTPGGYKSSEAGGSTIPVRCLSDSAGVTGADGTWSASTVLTPATVPTASTGSTWDTLSGLQGTTLPSGTTAYTYLVQRANAPAGTALNVLYQSALDALLGDSDPVSAVNVVWSSRVSSTIRAALKAHELSASGGGVGRMAISNPELSVQTLVSAVGTADPGVGAYRDEGLIYTWPGVQSYIPEAVNYNLKRADSSVTNTGILDFSAASWLASVLSLLAPELNPGTAANPVPQVLQSVLGLQLGAPTLGLGEYSQMRASGICGIRIEKNTGPIFQSGITSSLISGQKNISRRRMSYYIEDSLAQALISFVKLPLTQANMNSAVVETEAFMAGLKSVDNPAQARIKDYSVDGKSGNTAANLANGIYVIIVRGQLIASGDFIVLQAEISERTVIVNSVA
jgi:hypothetical protein